MNKQEIRAAYLAKREHLSEQDCLTRSQSIANRFFNNEVFSLHAISALHLFLPIKAKKEINTWFIFEKLKIEYPTLNIALSKSNFQESSMRLLVYSGDVTIVENTFGIPEPDGGKEIYPEQLDLVLVPLLAVDGSGNRVGYGKGFYDRLLAQCRPDCIKIGLSLEKPVPEIIPDPYDIPLDYCISPDKIYAFKKR